MNQALPSESYIARLDYLAFNGKVFISPESVKELNEMMCVTKDNWTPIPMYCSNCGALLYGYRNDEGKIKYECKRCGTVAVRVQKGCRHDKIDLYAPEGQIRYY